MQIPDIFKKVIADTFYDKNIEIWSSGTIKDDEGAVVGNGKQEKIDEFMGNFQFSTKEYIQQEYGKEIEANAIVTCERTLAKEGDILIYLKNKTHFELSRYTHEELSKFTNAELQNYMYEFEVVSVIPSDSHVTILVKRGGVNVKHRRTR